MALELLQYSLSATWLDVSIVEKSETMAAVSWG